MGGEYQHLPRCCVRNGRYCDACGLCAKTCRPCCDHLRSGWVCCWAPLPSLRVPTFSACWTSTFELWLCSELRRVGIGRQNKWQLAVSEKLLPKCPPQTRSVPAKRKKVVDVVAWFTAKTTDPFRLFDARNFPTEQFVNLCQIGQHGQFVRDGQLSHFVTGGHLRKEKSSALIPGQEW